MVSLIFARHTFYFQTGAFVPASVMFNYIMLSQSDIDFFLKFLCSGDDSTQYGISYITYYVGDEIPIITTAHSQCYLNHTKS